MKLHMLKCEYPYFNDVESGLKTFEIRRNDRDFQLGDMIILNGFKNMEHTGESIPVIVTYITDYAQKYGYVVLGIAKLEEAQS